MDDLTTPVGPGDHIEGKTSATIILVEYGDFQCSHSGEAYPLIKKLMKEFHDELLFVFRNFPDETHPEAMIAAQAAEAAGLQNNSGKCTTLFLNNTNNSQKITLSILQNH